MAGTAPGYGRVAHAGGAAGSGSSWSIGRRGRVGGQDPAERIPDRRRGRLALGAVLDVAEADVALAVERVDETRQRLGLAQRARLRTEAADRRDCRRNASAQRARLAGDGEPVGHRPAAADVAEHGLQRRAGQTVAAIEPRAVDEEDAVERDAPLPQLRLHHGRGPAGRVPPPPATTPISLTSSSARVVVARREQLADQLAERAALDGGDHRRPRAGVGPSCGPPATVTPRSAEQLR